MPRPLPAVLQDLLEQPDPGVIEEASAILASRARSAKYRRKSIGASLRELTGNRLPPDLRRELTERAMVLVEAEVQAGGFIAPAQADGDWLFLEDTARLLHVSTRTLKNQLRLPHYRRLYGWPWWDGHLWRFAGPAIRAETRSTFLASLPSVEPLQDLLPEWCTR